AGARDGAWDRTGDGCDRAGEAGQDEGQCEANCRSTASVVRKHGNTLGMSLSSASGAGDLDGAGVVLIVRPGDGMVRVDDYERGAMLTIMVATRNTATTMDAALAELTAALPAWREALGQPSALPRRHHRIVRWPAEPPTPRPGLSTRAAAPTF